MAWIPIGYDISVANSTLETDEFTPYMFNFLIINTGMQSYYNMNPEVRFGAGASLDGGNHYANRVETNGGTSVSTTDDDSIFSGFDGIKGLTIMYASNNPLVDKLVIWETVSNNDNGTIGQYPADRKTGVGKWVEDDSGSAPYNTASFDITGCGGGRSNRTGAQINIFGTGEF